MMRGRDVLWTLVETVLWFPRGVGATRPHPRQRPQDRSLAPRFVVEGRVHARRQLLCVSTVSVEHQLLCARVRAVTNLPTAPPLKPGRPRPTHPCTGPVVSARGRAYAAPVRSTAPVGSVPSRSYRHSAMTSLRASATMPTRRCPGPPRPNRRRYHCVRALSGCHCTHTHAVSTATRRTAATPARLIPCSWAM